MSRIGRRRRTIAAAFTPVVRTPLVLAPLILALLAPPVRAAGQEPRPRARALGLRLGTLPAGPHNDITDVAGVRVGHYTLHEGTRLHTGITAVLPHDGNVFHEKVPAAIVVGNGFGKLMGSTQVNELGELETPVLLTGTLNVPKVADGLIGYMLSLPGMEEVYSVNPVVGETNDGFLSDIRARPLGEPEVRRALAAATTGPVRLGAVGAGAGTRCFGFKGGIGSSSRRLDDDAGGWTVGVLVQTNFGGTLRIDGIPSRIRDTPLGEFLLRAAAGEVAAEGGEDAGEAAAGDTAGGDAAGGDAAGGNATAGDAAEGDAAGGDAAEGNATAGDAAEGDATAEGGADAGDAAGDSVAAGNGAAGEVGDDEADGSLMVVIATDAPLSHRNLRRLASRSLYGMARTGGFGSNGSGDYAIAFSTHERLRIRRDRQPGVAVRPALDNDAMTPLFLAVVEATEEAILDSLFTARTVAGHRGTAPALPVDEVLRLAGAAD